MKCVLRKRLDVPPVQETQELLGMLSDEVSELALKAARGDDGAAELLRMVRDEVHTLIADVRTSAGGES